MFTNNLFCIFPGIFIKNTTFEEFEEFSKQIHKGLEIHYNDEKEIIDSNKIH